MIVFLLALFFAAPDPAAAFAEGRALLERGEAAKASQLFEQAVALAPKRAEYHYWLARSYTSEAKATTNAVRLLALAWDVGEELELAVQLDPDLLDARVRLVQYYEMTPRVVGGSSRKAREAARELARRDATLGLWADGYLAYRVKQYGRARVSLRAAAASARDAKTKELALMWLGWLSQETQQYEEAFATWRAILAVDATQTAAWYEIGRTASFCRCEVEGGREALRKYMAAPQRDGPTIDDARKVLERLR
jgi:tetratricopeptide (TPR) repeat protein